MGSKRRSCSSTTGSTGKPSTEIPTAEPNIPSAPAKEKSAKPKRNCIASGTTMNSAKLAPKRNMIGDAITNGRNAAFSDR